MQKNNDFYILKACRKADLSTISYNEITGEAQEVENVYCYSYANGHVIQDTKRPTNVTYKPVVVIPSTVKFESCSVIMFDNRNTFIGSVTAQDRLQKIELKSNACRIYVNFAFPDNYTSKKVWFYAGYEVTPHYKKLELQSKKQSGQMFFRESLNGTISLFGDGCDYVKNTNIETNLMFAVFRKDELISRNIFNKTDCKFDYAKHSVELKLSPEDAYTNILDKYNDKYDIIKLAPKISRLTLRTRMAYQFYIAGANNITTVANGTYWEDDVNEPVSDATELNRKYHYSHAASFYEVHLEGFNYDINATYIVDENSNRWDAVSVVETPGGQVYNIPASVRFKKVRDARTMPYREDPQAFMLYDGTTSGLINIGSETVPTYVYAFDVYVIQIYWNDTVIYESNYFYCANRGFTITPNENTYPMTKVDQPVPMKVPTPNTFNLGPNVIEYKVYERIVCGDLDRVTIDGITYELFDLPRDDFAYNRANYKKCINAVNVKCYQVKASSNKPTKYGMDDYKKYFTSNDVSSSLITGRPIPISRSSWANTSIWILYNRAWFNIEKCFEKAFTLKDAYDLADIISTMLTKIDPSIVHGGTAEYSQFLYGKKSPLGLVDEYREGYRVYITPKSNVLKGNYDQAAQKGELSFEQLMDMLRDCFRCYWFIDENNRFRIEHVSYFLNGMSYREPSVQVNLALSHDVFNKKRTLYCQQEIEYEKSDLPSRFEFGWMDDCTDLFGNNAIDVDSEYISKSETESISPDVFSSDVDLMLCAPDKFSSDGFALLMANALTGVVPIGADIYFKDSELIPPYDADPQNFLVSWLHLIKYYMYDMPAVNITFDGVASNTYYMDVKGIKKCMKHEIEFPAGQFKININKLITTEIGDGYIEQMSTNIDTYMTKIELRYEPV